MTSQIFKFEASRERGPITKFRITPWFTQWSYQKLRLLLFPTVHLIPLLKTSLPFFTANHVWEHRSLFWFLEPSLRLKQYLDFNTRAQRDSFSIWNRQFSFARRAVFLPFVACKPNPPSFLSFATFYQPTQWNFLANSEVPQRKFLLTRSIPPSILLGR